MSRGRVAAVGSLSDLLSVAGRTTLRVAGLSGGLPAPVADLAADVAATGDVITFSTADSDVRRSIDAVYDAGGSVVAVEPKRESLEDYFTRMLSNEEGEVA
jgi:hypothetical protein